MSLDVADVMRIVNAHAPAGVEPVSDPDVDLYEQGFDSLDISRVFMAVEQAAGVTFADSDLDRMATVNNITAALNEKNPPASRP